MSEFKLVFSSLEENFDNSTIEECWSCTRPRKELSFLEGEMNVGITLQVKGVENYIHKYGKKQNRFQPDFIILTNDELNFIKQRLKDARELGIWKNPFKDFMPSQKIAIELFGDYWYSEKVIGVSEAEHLYQVKKAYNSIGWNVIILWERELKDKSGLSKVKQYLFEGDKYQEYLPAECAKYMYRPELYRKLGSDKQTEILEQVFNKIKDKDNLLPSFYDMQVDLKKITRRIKKGIKSRGVDDII